MWGEFERAVSLEQNITLCKALLKKLSSIKLILRDSYGVRICY
jgi:hypothetical protein